MFIAFLIVLTIAAMAAGRLMLGRWFNHLSVYSAIWGSMLILVQCNLILYNPISGMAWFEIFSAWLCLFFGSATLLLVRGRRSLNPVSDSDRWVPRLKTILWVFSLIGTVGVAAQVQAVIREFGSITGAIFVNASDLYYTRVYHPEVGLSGISYVGTFAPGACALAGIYSAKIGKPTLAALVPLILVALNGVLVMGRATLILAVIWFFAAFLHTPRKRFEIRRWQTIAAGVLAVSVLVGGIGLVSSTRGLSLNGRSVSPEMEWASGYLPLLPPLLFDYTGPVVGFSDYLDHLDKSPHAFWGMYTFAPIFRVMARFGADTEVPFYEEDYYTPYGINVMTYLKNVQSDFGIAGILIFPYLLGAAMTWFKLKLDEHYSPYLVILLAQGYLIVCYSFAYNPMYLGVWYFSLGLGLAACYWLKTSGADQNPGSIPAKVGYVS